MNQKSLVIVKLEGIKRFCAIENNTYHFVINTPPRPKKRPKVYRWATVNPSQDDEAIVAELVRRDGNKPKTPLSGQLRVVLKFYVKPPKATAKWKIPYMDREYIRPNKSPDLDNFTKLTLDALNGILWEDDRYIVEIHASKFYTSENPRTEIILDQLPDFTSKKEVERAIDEYKNSIKIDEFFDIED